MRLGSAFGSVSGAARPARSLDRRLPAAGAVTNGGFDADHERHREQYARDPRDDGTRCVKQGDPGYERKGEDEARRPDERRYPHEPIQQDGRVAWPEGCPPDGEAMGRFSPLSRVGYKLTEAL